jgi:hypothetical protein
MEVSNSNQIVPREYLQDYVRFFQILSQIQKREQLGNRSLKHNWHKHEK